MFLRNILFLTLLASCSSYQTKHFVSEKVNGKIEGLTVSDEFVSDVEGDLTFKVTMINKTENKIEIRRDEFEAKRKAKSMKPENTEVEIGYLNKEIDRMQTLLDINETTHTVQSLLNLTRSFSRQGEDIDEQLAKDQEDIESQKAELARMYQKRNSLTQEYMPPKITINPGQSISKKIKFDFYSDEKEERLAPLILTFKERVSLYKVSL